MSQTTRDIAIDNRNRLNAIIENSKHTFELNEELVLNPNSKIRVQNNVEVSKFIKIQKLLNYFESLGYITISDIYQANIILKSTYHWVEGQGYNQKIIYVKWLFNSQIYEHYFNEVVAINASDTTNDRIDIIAINLETQLLEVVEGTPSPVPALPSLPENLLQITFVYVETNTTSSTSVTNIPLYLENEEWTTQITSGTADFDSEINPATGETCISLATSSGFSLTGLQNLNNVSFFIFKINLTDNVELFEYIKIAFYDENDNIINSLLLSNNDFGFNITAINEWQTIVIPANALNFANDITLKKVVIAIPSSFPQTLFDDIILQTGINQPSNTNSFLPTGGYEGTALDLFELINNLKEEQILGTATENLTLTGSVDIDLTAEVHANLKLTGNTTITFTNTPPVGFSFSRTYKVYSDTTETLGITNSTQEYGEYTADGSYNLLTVLVSHTATEGLEIHVFFNLPN